MVKDFSKYALSGSVHHVIKYVISIKDIKKKNI